MSPIALVLLLITGLFGLVLLAKKLSGVRVCAICAAISGSWLTLLALRLFDVSIDPLLLGLLMGQSVVGVFYLVEKHVPESWLLFRLPFLLSLSLLTYTVAAPSIDLWSAYAYLALLWLSFGALFAYRQSPRIAQVTAHILECCKNW